MALRRPIWAHIAPEWAYSESVILRYGRLNRSKPLNMGYLGYPGYMGLYGLYGLLGQYGLYGLYGLYRLYGHLDVPYQLDRAIWLDRPI